MKMKSWLQIPVITDNSEKATTFDESLEDEKPFILLNKTLPETILIEYWLLPVGKELPESALSEIKTVIKDILPESYETEETEKSYHCNLNPQIGTISGIEETTYAKEIAAEIQEIIDKHAQERDGKMEVTL